MAISKTKILVDDINPSEIENVGQRLRSFRSSRGWTLDTLASHSGLSKSYLSRIEDGDRQPSIAALLNISRALGISLGELVSEQNSAELTKVVRGSEAIAIQGNGLVYQEHSGNMRGASMQPIRITVPVGRIGDELYRHDGEEWLYILSGVLELKLGDQTYELFAGDSIYFDATIGHRLYAKGERDVEAVLVASLSRKMLLSSYL
jgi:transcriptional regulator with XRE-family HTH domain